MKKAGILKKVSGGSAEGKSEVDDYFKADKEKGLLDISDKVVTIALFASQSAKNTLLLWEKLVYTIMS